VGRTQVFDWLSKFKSNVTSVDAEHSECPTKSKTDENGLGEGTYSQKQKNYYP
jgi:hypothetical protein